jgi:Ran GTPase-activating protein (RanGAP) involved in mRNA processing and transport
LGTPEAVLLKEVILSNPQLYVLKLSYNNLGDEGTSIIASAMLHNGVRHQLSVLDLGFNSMGDVGCGSLAVFCLAGNFNIQTLYISGNRFTDKGVLSIAGAILHGTALRSLHLALNDIGPMGMIAIAGSIAKNEARITQALATGRIDGSLVRRMEELHLGSTAIKSDGFVAIPTMLMTNLWMKTLSISNNELDDRDILLLAQALTENKLVPLESLHLSFNQITCHGVECLMNAVWGSETLHDLKLDNNLIKDRGAQLCAVALTSVPLRSLDLSFNTVTTTGIKAVMKNLAENTTLQSLSLSGIPIDQNASKALSYALAYNTSLEALYLDTCSPGFASQRHIVAGAVSNRTSGLRLLTGFNISRK